jgi:hypothetical protein
LSLGQRAADFEAKESAQISAGSSGLLVWDWLPAPSSPCSTDTFPGDPLMGVVEQGPT